MRQLFLSFLALALVGGCGGSATTDDGGSPDASDAASDGARPDATADMGIDAPEADAPGGDATSDTGCSTDADGDGHVSTACGGDDCNDFDASAYPGNTEVCDAAGHDDDCNPSTLGPDGDADGFPSTACCNHQVGGTLLCGTDCDDTRATVNPTAVESCNMVDDNCNGMVDEGIDGTYYPDCDGDMYGAAGSTAVSVSGCTPPATGPASCTSGHWSIDATDCDDGHASVNPGASEVCNGIDDNCNAMTDEGLTMTFYPDCDNDGHAATGATGIVSCGAPTARPSCPPGPVSWATIADDCNDASGTVHPGATETCDGIDDDCDATIDGAAASAWCMAGLPMPMFSTFVHTTAAACGTSAIGPSCVATACDAGWFACGTSGDTAGLGPVGCTTPYGSAACGSCSATCPDAACAAGSCVSDFVAVSAGDHTACAIRADGSVLCWGNHPTESTTSTMSEPFPQAVSGVTDAASIAAGDLLCVRHATGAVDCTVAGVFVSSGITTAASVSAPFVSICVRTTTGAVQCWGNNYNGQVGDATTTTRTSPVAVSLPRPATDVAAGYGSSCAVLDDGTVRCWGADFMGELGDGAVTHTTCDPLGSPHDCSPTPVVAAITNAVDVEVGNSLACARRTDGSVWCWGYLFGSTPVRVGSFADATALAVGERHACVVHVGGTVSCWGDDSTGALGDGTHTTTSSPVGVVHTAGGALTGVSSLAAGFGFTCALRTDHSLVCWGSGADGDLGDGTTMDRATPP